MSRAIVGFTLGALLALVVIVQLRGCGPTLGDQISEGICTRIGGALDSVRHTCIVEDGR